MDQTHVFCTGRWTLIHCITRGVLGLMFLRFHILHIHFAGFCGYDWDMRMKEGGTKQEQENNVNPDISWQRARDMLGRSEWGWHQATLDLRNHLRPILVLLLSGENVLPSRPLISTQEVLSLSLSLWLKVECVNMLQRYFLSFLPTHLPSSFYFIYLILAALVLHWCM